MGGLIGSIIYHLLAVGGGIYLVLVFGKFITPKFKNKEDENKFLKQREEKGTYYLFIGIMLLLVEATMIVMEFFI